MNYQQNLLLKITNIGVIGMIDGQFDRDFRSESQEVKDQRVTREVLKELF